MLRKYLFENDIHELQNIKKFPSYVFFVILAVQNKKDLKNDP